jgi:phospholipid/cholesterol/gamma-HCH transport system ATP-binding protein
MSDCHQTRNPFTHDESPAVGVKLEHVSKNFGSLAVLKDVSLEVHPGEIFVLMGPSGSGKSVLLKHIVGLELPTSGKVSVAGLDASDPATRGKVRMALVFQAGALFNSLSVYDNLALYLREHRVTNEAGIREKVMRALQILSLENAARKSPSDLSGGMRKRVAIARALVMEPQLLLYDEPTTLKDEYHVTSFVVSHDRSLALSIADRVGILMGGRLLTVASPAALRETTDPQIADFLNPLIDVKNPRFKQLEA